MIVSCGRRLSCARPSRFSDLNMARGSPADDPEGSFLRAHGIPDDMGSSSKHLVELKARYEDLGKARALLAGGERLGSYRQIDTYFSLGERRMKVRVVEGQAGGEIVYYTRPEEGGSKGNRVAI